MSEKVGVFAGSFDPITKGHLWIIESGANLFDRLIVVVGVNAAKKYTFTDDERVALVKGAIKELPAHLHDKISVAFSGDGFLINTAQELGATHLIRGVRDMMDYQMEANVNRVNLRINNKIQTVVFLTPADMSEVSSSTVKGLVGPTGWEDVLSVYVTDNVRDALRAKLIK